MNSGKITCSANDIHAKTWWPGSIWIQHLSHVIPIFLHYTLTNGVENNHSGQLTHVERIYSIWIQSIYSELMCSSASPKHPRSRCLGVSVTIAPPEYLWISPCRWRSRSDSFMSSSCGSKCLHQCYSRVVNEGCSRSKQGHCQAYHRVEDALGILCWIK